MPREDAGRGLHLAAGGGLFSTLTGTVGPLGVDVFRASTGALDRAGVTFARADGVERLEGADLVGVDVTGELLTVRLVLGIFGRAGRGCAFAATLRGALGNGFGSGLE